MKIPRLKDWSPGKTQVALLVRNANGEQLSFSSNPLDPPAIESAAGLLAVVLDAEPELAHAVERKLAAMRERRQ